MNEFEGLTQEANDALSLVAARVLVKQYRAYVVKLNNENDVLRNQVDVLAAESNRQRELWATKCDELHDEEDKYQGALMRIDGLKQRIAALEKALKDIDSVCSGCVKNCMDCVEWQRIANAALAGAVVRLEDDSDEGLKQARQEMRKLLSQ